MEKLSDAQLSAALDAAAALGSDAASACAAVRRAHEFSAPKSTRQRCEAAEGAGAGVDGAAHGAGGGGAAVAQRVRVRVIAARPRVDSSTDSDAALRRWTSG